MAKTILTVDDSASMRQMIKLTLSGAGYDVTEANDGAQGLATARTKAFDMVLTDLNMPGMDGVSMIKEIRKLQTYTGIPIVLTTESDAEKKAQAKRGRHRLDHQPFQPDSSCPSPRRFWASEYHDPKEISAGSADCWRSLKARCSISEHAPGDSALIDTAFARCTRSGLGSMFGFEEVAAFTHHVETAFDKVRQGGVAPNRELIAITLRARSYAPADRGPRSCDVAAGEAILAQLARIMEADASVTASPGAGARSRRPYRVRIKFPHDVMATGTHPLRLLDELCALGSATVIALTDDIPPLAELDPTACYVGWEVILSTSHPSTAIEDVFLFVRDEMTLAIEEVMTSAEDRLGEILADRGDVGAGAVQVALDQQKPIGELLVKAGAVSPAKVTAALAEQQHLRKEGIKANTNSGIRVPAERLDELMDRVGELVIAQSRLRQIAANSADQQVKSVAEEIERLVLELRDTTMGIRMVPIGSLFGRFRRVVHDLSRDLGKEVELTMAGEETELDKTVIEQLNDPLVHLIRNAIDHGLEDPNGRAEAGKSQMGRIDLSARHAGMEVLITIKDDGRGLNRERIRARAEERGLLAKDAVVSDSELFQVLFQPGFSTAAQVTSLSGRGVGMDRQAHHRGCAARSICRAWPDRARKVTLRRR